MKLSDFHFDLPKQLIAQYPLPNRSDSRLLCLNATDGVVRHSQFVKLPDELDSKDLLIFNNTRVMPARLYGHKQTGGQLEILIERILDSHRASVLLKAGKTPKIDAVLVFAQGVKAVVVGRQDPFFILEFNQAVSDILIQQGKMPLPPYMERADEALDKERYQTLYASVDGAVAAPTAGLHFDQNLLQSLKIKGIETAEVTLHVGAGTFWPVRVENIKEHQMHCEYIEVSERVCHAIHQTRRRGGRVIAVGTTTVRCLETAALDGEIRPYRGDTDIFIYPGYRFNTVDAIITNFHMPESTLLMLVSAFAGRELVLGAYAGAVKQGYRFFSYGDAMFITK